MFKSLLRRLLGIIALLILAVFWVLLDARPALANDLPGANFQDANLTNAIVAICRKWRC